MKSKGPRTDPCGTPIFIIPSSELNPLIVTNWRLFSKYDLYHLLAVPLIP